MSSQAEGAGPQAERANARVDAATSQAGAKLAANGLDVHLPVAGGSQTLPKRPERGEEIELQIDSLAHGGEGVGRLGDTPSGAHSGGYVVFVSGALPGDRVRAVVVKRKRSYAHARMVEILQESPERIAPTAKHPGVAWQVLPYQRQLQIKQEQVDDALRRIGRLDGFDLQEIVPALQQWRYRNKLEYSFGTGYPPDTSCVFHCPEKTPANPGQGFWCVVSTPLAVGSGSIRSMIACWPQSSATRHGKWRLPGRKLRD